MSRGGDGGGKSGGEKGDGEEGDGEEGDGEEGDGEKGGGGKGGDGEKGGGGLDRIRTTPNARALRNAEAVTHTNSWRLLGSLSSSSSSMLLQY